MTYRTRVAAVSLLTLVGVTGFVPGSAPRAQSSDSPLLSVMQAELQRNFSLLNKEATPAYFIGYTVHDIHQQ